MACPPATGSSPILSRMAATKFRSEMSNAVIRKRRQRERERNGVVLLEIQVPHEPLTYALEVAGLLSPEQLEDRYAISRAVEALVARVVCPA